MRWLDSIADSVDMNMSKRQEIMEDIMETGVLQSMELQRVGRALATKQQNQAYLRCSCHEGFSEELIFGLRSEGKWCTVALLLWEKPAMTHPHCHAVNTCAVGVFSLPRV